MPLFAAFRFPPIVCTILDLYLLVMFVWFILSLIPRLPEGIRRVRDVLGAVITPVARPVGRLVDPVIIGHVSLDMGVIIVAVVLGVLSRTIC